MNLRIRPIFLVAFATFFSLLISVGSIEVILEMSAKSAPHQTWQVILVFCSWIGSGLIAALSIVSFLAVSIKQDELWSWENKISSVHIGRPRLASPPQKGSK